MPRPARQAPDARRIALGLLHRLERSDQTLDRLMTATLARHPHLSRRDRALVFALTFGVQRWRGRLDWIADHFASRPLSGSDPRVRNILRLALCQLLILSRIPASAAVHTAVGLAKAEAPWAAGFVNAVLRRALDPDGRVRLPPLPDDPVAALAVETAFPRWLAARWVEQDAMTVARTRCEAANRIPPLTLRAHGADRDALDSALAAAGIHAVPTPLAPAGRMLDQMRGPVETLPGYPEGRFQVQDEAAQLVGLLAAPAPGMQILDACAGRGGKTGHLADLCADRAAILATDSNANRLADLASEMRRLAITGVTARQMDWLSAGSDAPDGFDLILLDAPCSGLGVLRRNPDAKWRRQPEDLTRHARRQGRLLRRLAGRLRPGGTLVYAVCSTEPEETTAVVDAFLDRRSDYAVAPPPEGFPAGARRRVRPDGTLVTDPARDDMDGFFMVRLERRATAS